MGPAVLGAVASLFGSAFQASNQNKAIDKQIAAQREQQDRAARYNMQLAQYQNSANIAQWHRENAYNDPSAQMARYRAAGLNPDLIYGNGANSVSAQSPMMTSGEPMQPMDMSAIGQRRSPIGDALSAIPASIGAAKTMFEAYKARKDVDSVQQDVISKQLDNAIKSGTKDAIIKGAYLELGLKTSQLKLNGKQIEKVSHEIGVLDSTASKLVAEVDKVKAETASMKQDVIFKKIQNYYADRSQQLQLAKLASEVGLTLAQTREIMTLLSAKLLNIQADTRLKNSAASLNKVMADKVGVEIDGITIQNGILALDFESRSIDYDNKIASNAVRWKLNNWDIPGVLSKPGALLDFATESFGRIF